MFVSARRQPGNSACPYFATHIEALKQSGINLILDREKSFVQKFTENVRESKETFRACYMEYRNPDDYTFQNLLT